MYGMKAKYTHALLFLVFFAGSFFSFIPKAHAVDAWWDVNWGYRMKITFDNSTRAENLTNFPIQVALNTSRVTYSNILSSGRDVRFVDANGTTVLNYEVERWNPTGTSTLWVKVPQIDASSATDYIYMYYGNASATSANTTASSTAVWDSNFLSVLHMNQNPSGTAPQILDSTTNSYSATSSGIAATSTTRAGDGLDLNGTTNYLTYASTTLPVPINAGTVEIWYKPDTYGSGGTGRYLFSRVKSGNTWPGEWRIYLDDSNSSKLTAKLECGATAYTVTSAAAPSLGIWGYAASVWDKTGGASNMKLYADGSSVGTPVSPNCGMEVYGESHDIGRNNALASGYFDGMVDEFRLSNAVRSANWINATNASIVDSLSTYASVETYTPGSLTSTNVEPASLGKNAAGNVTVSFTTTTTLPADGKIVVIFPTSLGSGFTFNSGGTTAASSLSGIDGSLSVSISTNTITLTRSGGTASTAGAKSFVLSNIQNPSATGSTGTYTIKTTDSSNNILDQDTAVSADTIVYPSTPVGVVAVPYEGRVYVQWTAATSTVTDYQIDYKLSSGGTWSTFSDGVSTATSTIVTGLTNSSAYDFRVSALNGTAQGDYSETKSTTPAYRVMLTGTSPSDGSATTSSTIYAQASTTFGYGGLFRFWVTNSLGAFASTSATSTRYGDYSLANMTQILPKTDLALTVTDLSGQVYVPTTGTLFTVHNSQNKITEVTREGVTVRTITCSGCGDIEDITLVSSVASSTVGGYDHTFMISTEDGYDGVTLDANNYTNLQIFPVIIHSSGAVTVTRANYYSTGVAAAAVNDGLEGIAYNSNTGTYFVSVEGQATQSTEPTIYETTLGSGHSASSVRICSNLNFRTYLTEANTAGNGNTTYADISGLDYVPSVNRLYVISHKADKVIEVDVSNRSSCSVLGQISIGMRANSGSNYNFEMPEGVSWDDTGDYLYISAESDYWSYWRTGAYSFKNTFRGFADGTYNLYASAIDQYGNSATSTGVSFTVDRTGPVSSSIASSTTSSTATVTWTTDESSNSKVSYGTASGNYTLSTSSSSMVTSHSLTLTGLSTATSYYYVVVSADSLGNTSTSSEKRLLTDNVDATAPTITNVSSDKANGSYTTGEVIDIDVTFSEAVTSTGSVTVTLETGTTDRTCTFTVSSSSTGTCNYTVQAGDTSADLTVSSISGTIVDGSSNAMTNFVPATNLAANKAIVIDAAGPAFSSIAVSSIATTTAIVTWTTDEAASTRLTLGLSTAYGSSTPLTDTSPRVTSHSVSLGGLRGCTLYYYQVVSADALSNQATSTGSTFQTIGCVGSASVSASSTAAVTTSGGGTVSLTATGGTTLQLTVPSGFAGVDATFQVHQVDGSSVIATAGQVSGFTHITNQTFDLQAYQDASTNISSFNNALTVTITYSDSDISGINESSLVIYRYDGTSWSALSNCTITASSNTISCTTTAFSTFALFGQAGSSSSSSGSSSGTGGNGPIAQGGVIPNVPVPRMQTVYPDGRVVYLDTPVAVVPGTPSSNSTSFSTVFTRNLAYGSRDAQVIELQTMLARYADIYPEGTLSGWFGPATRRAVERFQIKHGIVKAGEVGFGSVGPKTRLMLNQLFDAVRPDTSPTVSNVVPSNTTGSFTSPLKLGTEGSEVKLLQVILNSDKETQIASEGAGSHGQETERFGLLTQVAVKKFQIKYGIAREGSPGYGSVGPATRKKLNELLLKAL
jgi:uncharacterized protein YjiK